MPSGDNRIEGASFVFQSPSTGDTLQESLEDGFESDPSYDGLRILAATVSDRGVDRIEEELTTFCENGGEIEIYIGLSMGPDPDGIRRLKRLQDEYPGLVSLRLIKNGPSVNLFHPKVYWFHSDTAHQVILGSPNWSDLGLENSVEAFSVVTESIGEDGESNFILGVREAFNEVRTLNDSPDSWGSLHPPSESILKQLESAGGGRSGGEGKQVEIDAESSDNEGLWPLTRAVPELVMELNKESRMSQIVPPKEIWERFFGVNTEEFREEDPDLPFFELRNPATDNHSHRQVVAHDHQGTIEIPEAKNRKDPSIQRAFLVFRKAGEHTLDYQLYLENEDEQANEIADFLETHGYTPGHSSRLTFLSRPN